MAKQRRDSSVDYLRVVGLLLIILAHVHAPKIVHQIRTFDVPLMVFTSGMCYAISSKKRCMQIIWSNGFVD